MNTSKNPTAPFWTRIVDGIKGRSTKASIATSGSHSSNGSHIIPPENLVYGSCTLRSPTAIVHLDYDPKKLEPKPSSGWTRFVCISDTHTRTFEVPDGDVLLHSGDLTRTGKFAEFEATVEWLCGLPHKVKIIIAGNHDLPLHEDWYDVNFMQWNQVKQSVTKIKALLKGRKARSSGLVYLQDEKYEFQTKKGGKTWSVYGSPWSPWFHNWAFNYLRKNGKDLVHKFPKTDILLTHGPPSGIFDLTRSGDLAGCEDLRSRLEELQPRLHVFGHIHEARGAHLHDWTKNQDGKYECPVVQVDDADEIEDEDSHDNEPEETEAVEGKNADEESVQRTVFANAAVFSLQGKGRKIPDTGPRLDLPVGGPGFQPIVVDLKD